MIPLIAAVGSAIDYGNIYMSRARMQAQLDAAVLNAAKSLKADSASTTTSRVTSWFASQTDLKAAQYTLAPVTVDPSKTAVAATLKARVDTALMRIVGVNSVDIVVQSRAEAPREMYQSIYLALDKSASMMLAATAADQNTMLSANGCVFACHTAEGQPIRYGASSYKSVYDLSRALGVKLRADVIVDASLKVADQIDVADPKHTKIRMGLYTIGMKATQVLAPTRSTSTVRSYLTSRTTGLTSDTSEDASYFDIALPQLAKLVGAAGDGSSSASPRKLVLIATDGVQSQREWVLSAGGGARTPTSTWLLPAAVTPINPDWCKSFKDKGVDVGILYTQYLPMTWDWGYNATVGASMSSSGFNWLWGGTMRSGLSEGTRQAYIPVALQDCASSANLYISAATPAEITAGVSEITRRYLSTTRLSP